MGRHSSNEGSGRALLLPLGLVGVLAAGGITWYAVTQGGDQPGGQSDIAVASTDDTLAQQIKAAHDHSGHTAAQAVQTPDTSTITEDAAAETTVVDAGLPAELTACVSAVQAGESVASAAALSAEHWKIHYTAQLKLQRGDYTLERTTQDWADTKVLGPDDVARFDRAQQSWDKVVNACAHLDPAALAADQAEPAADCVERAEALAVVATRGAAVNADWADHIEQMKVKADTPADEYYAWWIDVVEAAPDAMDPYEDAVADLADAPKCTLG